MTRWTLDFAACRDAWRWVADGRTLEKEHSRCRLPRAGIVIYSTETYRLMDAPWGLLARVARPARGLPAPAPADAFLDATVAMAFVDPELGYISPPNTITWSGSLVAPRDGEYRFAFAADDPVRVLLDDQPMDVVWVKPEQWQSVGIGTRVRLSEGRHTVQVAVDVTHGGREVVRWMWVPPAAGGSLDANGEWTVVPPTALRPDPPVAPKPAGR